VVALAASQILTPLKSVPLQNENKQKKKKRFLKKAKKKKNE
jgi:hypothetical protein